MKSLTLQSPSKVNLLLRVVGRRRDGYHHLVTVFQRLSLCDEVKLRKKVSGVSLSCRKKTVPCGEKNLMIQSYRELQKEFPRLGGVSIALKKKIPLGAGLGGGSSNAATLLLGMKRLYRLPINRSQLYRIGQRLGADVPFFLSGASLALGTGRGDLIEKRRSSRKWFHLLVLSNKGLMTKKVFQGISKRGSGVSLTKAKHTARLLCTLLQGKDLRSVAGLLKNDLEPSAFRLRPSLKKHIVQLQKCKASAVRMSGSGATVYAMFTHLSEAKRVARKMRKIQSSKKILICHTF